MTNEQFDQLVNRVQTQYGSRPIALRFRIAMLLGIGYSGFLAVLLLVLALSALLATGAILTERAPSIILLAIVAVLLAFGLCQALVFLWIPFEPPVGRVLRRGEAPALFQLLETMQTQLQAKRFDQILVTPDLNAGVQMIPRLGMFGFSRSYLYLGIPLMRILTTEQFSAVLAHEFAHYSSRHDRFGTWIYRLRQTWAKLFAELQGNQSGGVLKYFRGIIRWFIDWFWPRFNAYAFVVSRANEYEADRTAAVWGGTGPTVEALHRLECFSHRFYEKFHERLTQMAKVEDSVPDDILERMAAFLEQAPDPADSARWIEQSVKKLTGNVDTHPSFSDRMRALGENADRFLDKPFPQVPKVSAVDELLQADLVAISRDVNLQWQKENRLKWQNVYHQARRAERQLASVVKSPESVSCPEQADSTPVPEVDADQLWREAMAVSSLHGLAAALPTLRTLLAQHPSHAQANVTVGRHLLENGQSEGEQFLRRVLQDEDNELTPVACDGLISYFQKRGMLDRVQETLLQLSKYEIAQAAAFRERSSVTAADRFLPHGLSDTEIEAITRQLVEETDLVSAWLVQKELKYFPKQRLFVLVVQTKTSGLFRTSNSQRDQWLVSRLITQVKLPGRFLIISPQGGFRSLAKKIVSRSDASLCLQTSQTPSNQ